MTMTRMTWSTLRRLVLADGSRVEPECVEAVRVAIPDDPAEEVNVGIGPAAELLDVYRYRYQSIEAFRVNNYGWPGFFSALEAATGRIGLLAIRSSGWRFIVLLSEDLDVALACLCRPPSPDKQPAELASTGP
jgi:hypothetical protein